MYTKHLGLDGVLQWRHEIQMNAGEAEVRLKKRYDETDEQHAERVAAEGAKMLAKYRRGEAEKAKKEAE